LSGIEGVSFLCTSSINIYEEMVMSQESIKEAVLATVEAIQKDPDVAKVRYSAETQWEEDVRCTGKVREFDPMVIDEPAAFGGGDSAVSPADVVLIALGTCQEIMYVALASTMDIPLEEVTVGVKADLDLRGLAGLDPEIPPGLLEMTYDVKIKSSASIEDLKRLADVVENQCPLLDTITRGVKVTGKVNFNDSVDYVAAGSYIDQKMKRSA
jgi:putative redox protein